MYIRRSNYAAEGKGSWIGTFVFWLAVVLTSWVYLFFPTAFSNDGRVISAFVGFLGIGNAVLTFVTQKRISFFCVAVTIISIVWFFLAGIQGSVFQLSNVIQTVLTLLLLDSL